MNVKCCRTVAPGPGARPDVERGDEEHDSDHRHEPTVAPRRPSGTGARRPRPTTIPGANRCRQDVERGLVHEAFLPVQHADERRVKP